MARIAVRKPELFANPEFLSEAYGSEGFFQGKTDFRFSEEGKIRIEGKIYSVTEDRTRKIICVRLGEIKIFAYFSQKGKAFEIGGNTVLSVMRQDAFSQGIGIFVNCICAFNCL